METNIAHRRKRKKGEVFIDKREGKSFHPVNLAFVGDAVYEQYVRRHLVLRHRRKRSGELHRMCVQYVRAGAQAEIVDGLKDEWTEEEFFIYRRGRNAATKSVPKNTEIQVYKKATGFEALIGYLFLTGNQVRLEEVVEEAILLVEQKESREIR
ncbi:MAG TPA: Mini-ribonuclease 3 [Eubacteriaceae bacterium]|nr:Mini-ribonuclease 3 [Eubacteriaceae bacterium]